MQQYIIFSLLLFTIGIIGLLINRKNMIVLLMCIEIILLAANTNFVVYSKYWDSVTGQVFVFFVMTVAATEAAIGLALLVLIFRDKKSINAEDLNRLKG